MLLMRQLVYRLLLVVRHWRVSRQQRCSEGSDPSLVLSCGTLLLSRESPSIAGLAAPLIQHMDRRRRVRAQPRRVSEYSVHEWYEVLLHVSRQLAFSGIHSGLV